MLDSKKSIKIMMLGLRGFPDVQGGVETHCENLCHELAKQRCELVVLTRSPYTRKIQPEAYHGIGFKRLWAPKSKTLETIVHTFLGVVYAALNRPDVLHIQAIGPAVWTPLARLLGLRVVVTHHGPDYDRQKWGWYAKLVLRVGERLGMRYANDRIVISETIRQIIRNKYGLNSVKIPNGVALPNLSNSLELLEEFQLVANRYILLVSRLVREKRHLDLIEAYKQGYLEDWKLVIVGDADHPDEYVKQLKLTSDATLGVVMTGYQSGDTLKALYQHAGIFVLPSSHEGLPIALLEALSFGLPVIASDIPANKEVGLGPEHYFPLGDVSELTKRLQYWAERQLTNEDRESIRLWVEERFDWRRIAQDTCSVYRNVMELRTEPL